MKNLFVLTMSLALCSLSHGNETNDFYRSEKNGTIGFSELKTTAVNNSILDFQYKSVSQNSQSCEINGSLDTLQGVMSRPSNRVGQPLPDSCQISFKKKSSGYEMMINNCPSACSGSPDEFIATVYPVPEFCLAMESFAGKFLKEKRYTEAVGMFKTAKEAQCLQAYPQFKAIKLTLQEALAYKGNKDLQMCRHSLKSDLIKTHLSLTQTELRIYSEKEEEILKVLKSNYLAIKEQCKR